MKALMHTGKPKCVFVIGPESSGSMLVAKICAHVLGIQNYGAWDGVGWSEGEQHKVCHRSLPYGRSCQFPDIQEWVTQYNENYELYFVLSTRDISISQRSRFLRWGKGLKHSKRESNEAARILIEVLESNHKTMIWSYETFMLLKQGYLKQLYSFLEITSVFMPEIHDGNTGHVRKTPLFRKMLFKVLRKLNI